MLQEYGGLSIFYERDVCRIAQAIGNRAHVRLPLGWLGRTQGQPSKGTSWLRCQAGHRAAESWPPVDARMDRGHARLAGRPPVRVCRSRVEGVDRGKAAIRAAWGGEGFHPAAFPLPTPARLLPPSPTLVTPSPRLGGHSHGPNGPPKCIQAGCRGAPRVGVGHGHVSGRVVDRDRRHGKPGGGWLCEHWRGL